MAKLFTMYAAPAMWGPKVQIQSVFGKAIWCKFSVSESVAKGPVVFQYWSSDSKKWLNAIPGQILNGQSVWLAAKSTGTGGQVTIMVSGSAILKIGDKTSILIPVTLITENPIKGVRLSKSAVFLAEEDGNLLEFRDDDGPIGGNVREITPVDQDGNPIGPTVDVDIGSDPNTTTQGEMIDDEGNAASDPFDIPDYAAPADANESGDAPSEGPSNVDSGDDRDGDDRDGDDGGD